MSDGSDSTSGDLNEVPPSKVGKWIDIGVLIFSGVILLIVVVHSLFVRTPLTPQAVGFMAIVVAIVAGIFAQSFLGRMELNFQGWTGFSIRATAGFAVFFLTVFALFQKPELFTAVIGPTQSINITLMSDGRILAKSFDASVVLPGGHDPITRPGKLGVATFQLPPGVTEIPDVVIECDEWISTTKGPFKIPANRTVQIEMKSISKSSPPASAEDLPSIHSFSELPDKQIVENSSSVRNATLRCRNATSKDLVLYLCDFDVHYFPGDQPFARTNPWMKWDLKANSEFEPWTITSPSGWYGIVVQPASSTARYALGCENLGQSISPTLTFSSTGNSQLPVSYTLELGEIE